MAEVIGVFASVATVIELSAKVISRCKHLIETAQDAPRDLRHIFIDISSLKSTLENLKFLADVDSDFSDAVQNLNAVDGAVKGCQNTVEDLAAELEGLSIVTSEKSAQTSLGKRLKIKGTLKWCLNKDKVRKLLDEATQHKSTIALALVSEVSRDVKDLKVHVGEIRDDLAVSTQRNICNWIERTNPTSDHNAATKLREEDTCYWILRSPQWTQWLSGAHRFLWVYGIPGAGKTILASFAISKTMEFCSTSGNKSACFYYYCSYRQTNDQTLAFMSWVVSQLCRRLRSIPEALLELYDSNACPTILQLTQCLESLLRNMDRVYIIVDAVDECDTSDLLPLLVTLASGQPFANLQVLATSRDYIDISNALRPISTPLSMSNELIDEDIRKFVTSELQTNKKLARWPAVFPEITEALVSGAKGMFRWAWCQLSVLQQKRTEPDVRKAITELPKSLDETYERILLNIPKEHWPAAHKALTWICVHDELRFYDGIPANCLLEAIFSTPDNPWHPEHYREDLAFLQEICGCLIRTSPVDETNHRFEAITLAHYTVFEYISSPRILQSDVAEFAFSRDKSIHEFVKDTLRICGQLDLEQPPGMFYHNLGCYSREVSKHVPAVWESMIVEDLELWNLYLKVLESPNHRCDPELEYFVDELIYHWNRILTWENRPETSVAQHCTAWAKSIMMECHRIANRYVEDKNVQELLCATTTWNTTEGKLEVTPVEITFHPYEILPSQKYIRSLLPRLDPTSRVAFFITSQFLNQ